MFYLLQFIYIHSQQLSYVTLNDHILSKRLIGKCVKINPCCLVMMYYPTISVDGLNKTTKSEKISGIQAEILT